MRSSEPPTRLRPGGFPGRGLRLRLATWAALAALLGAGPALAQVTNTSDEDPPPEGSLRSEVEDSASGERIEFQLGDSDSTESVISLRTVLPYDNTVTLDNSNTSFGTAAIQAPDAGRMFEIDPGVELTIRDVGIRQNSLNSDGAILFNGSNSSLVFDYRRDDQIVDVDITGGGSVFKTGTAVLELRGTNTFSGDLVVRQGDVKGGLTSIANGVNSIDLAPSGSSTVARIVFDITGTGEMLGSNPPITDSSSAGGTPVFVKAGSGDLDIQMATIAPTIGIRVENGTLNAGPANLAFGRSFTIDSGSTLAVQPDPMNPFGTVVADGPISGAGLLRSQASNFRLTGDLTGFSGTLETQSLQVTQVDPLVAPTAPLPFDIEVNGTTSSFIISDDDGVTLSGNIRGTGLFQKVGTGTTTLTGIATHTGGTAVSAGTLIGNTNNLQRTVNVSAGAALAFDQALPGTFAGSIVSGGGAITVRKLGSSRLALGATQAFDGSLVVEQGELFFESGVGLANANLLVGTASPTATADLSAAFDSSQLPAGNTVNIGGGLAFASDARLFVDLDDGNAVIGATPTNTRFAAAGAVTIDPAARLFVRLEPGEYLGSPSFDILQGSSVAGTFDIVQSLLFFDVTGAVVGNSYRITLDPSGETLAGNASTRNQAAVGGALDNLRAAGSGGDPALQTILESLNTIQRPEVSATLDALSADDLGAATNVRLEAAARTYRSLSNRLALHRNQAVGHQDRLVERQIRERRLRAERLRRRGRRVAPSRVDAGPERIGEEQDEPLLAWFEVGGADGNLDADEEKGYNFKYVGPLFGVDTELTEEARVGFALAGTRYVYDVDGSNDKGTANAVEGTLYGAWVGEPVEALLAFRYGRSWVDTKRILAFQGDVNRVEGDYEGNEYGFYAEVTRGFGDFATVEVAPYASLAYTRVDYDDFEESGNNPLRMQVEDGDVDSAITGVGFRIATEREMDQGLIIRPHLKAAYLREWADIDRDINGQFASGGGRFQLEGAELPRDVGEVSVGWEIAYARSANLFVDWNGRFGEDLVENALALGLRVAW